jgi:hypothetical protein
MIQTPRRTQPELATLRVISKCTTAEKRKPMAIPDFLI